MLKKDKQKVIGEELPLEKLAILLELEPAQGENPDFHILTKAYRGLPAHEFERFLTLYKETGRSLNPSNSEGITFLASISQNERQQEYVALMQQAGAA